MKSIKLMHYRDLLVDARRDLVRDADRVLEAIPDQVHPPGEHEIAPSEGVEIEMFLERGDKARVDEIDAALERLKTGTFGKCCECGAEIPAARLEAVPFARYCMTCEKSRGAS